MSYESLRTAQIVTVDSFGLLRSVHSLAHIHLFLMTFNIIDQC